MPTYDLYIEPAPIVEQQYGQGLLTIAFPRAVGVRGPYKLVVQWVKRFMTPKGSDPIEPNSGTEFPLLIGANLEDIEDARDVVLLAVEDCNQQVMQAQGKYTLDDDEILSTAALTKFEAVGVDGFSAWVDIQNVVGQSITVRVPQHVIRTV